jgi:GNAT superfamily N-acetyltransferase
MTEESEIEIVPLTPDRRSDWLHLFDGKGFADNPDWSGCFCRCYHFGGSPEEWEEQPAQANREAACGLIAEGKMQGWLALRDGEAIGWINDAAKQTYKALRGEDVPGRHDDETAMIVCFLVEPGNRGAGIATRLLDVALAGLRQKGLQWVEAKPAKVSASQRGNYHGPLAMYEKAGFAIVGDFSDRQYLVRREL